jgi:hypothetical protein
VVAPEHFDELKAVCSKARALTDGPLELIHLPKLIVYSDGKEVEVEGLLCLSQHQGYSTRLFLSQPFPAKEQNWSTQVVLGRLWHTWSWNHVPAHHRPAEVLAQHLRALR